MFRLFHDSGSEVSTIISCQGITEDLEYTNHVIYTNVYNTLILTRTFVVKNIPSFFFLKLFAKQTETSGSILRLRSVYSFWNRSGSWQHMQYCFQSVSIKLYTTILCGFSSQTSSYDLKCPILWIANTSTILKALSTLTKITNPNTEFRQSTKNRAMNLCSFIAYAFLKHLN